MIKSKKLSSLVAASLILAGGSFLGVQTVSADDSTRLAAVEALASQNSGFISELTKKVDNISTTPGQLQQIDTNKADIATNKGNIAANKTDIAANKTAIDQNKTDIATNKTDIAKEAAARKDADTKLDTRITNVKDYLEKQTAADYVSKTDAAVQDGAVVKADKTIGENVTNLDGALAKETAARIGADKAQDKVIQTVNDNLVKSVNTINKNVADGFNALNATDQKLQGNIDAEAKARADKDTAHDTAIKANTDNITKIQNDLKASNLNDMSKTAASLKSYDTQMSTVQALAAGNKDNIDKNKKAIADEATARDKADQKEASERKAEDSQLNTKMTNGFAAIQGQQDVQDAKIDKNHTDIQTNAGKIQNNQDAIKANSDRLDNHEERIAGNENNIATNAKNISKEISDRQDADTALQKNIDKEASERKAEDSQLNTKMTNGFAAIQGQQDVQDAKIDKNHTDIQTNAGKIQNNQDAIKANSDRLDNHEERIAGNENNIATNAKNISKEISDRQDADTALQKNIDKEASARGDKDKEHDTAIAANKKAIGDEAAARQADISRLDNKIHDVSKEVDTVGALSMAMSGLHPLSYDEGDARFQLSAAVGTYDGTEALALGGFYHFNRDSMLSVGVATDLGADEHRMGANVGYTRRIGQGGHVSRPSEGTVSDIMKDIKNLEQKQAKLEQENEQLKQQLAALKK